MLSSSSNSEFLIACNLSIGLYNSVFSTGFCALKSQHCNKSVIS